MNRQLICPVFPSTIPQHHLMRKLIQLLDRLANRKSIERAMLSQWQLISQNAQWLKLKNRNNRYPTIQWSSLPFIMTSTRRLIKLYANKSRMESTCSGSWVERKRSVSLTEFCASHGPTATWLSTLKIRTCDSNGHAVKWFTFSSNKASRRHYCLMETKFCFLSQVSSRNTLRISQKRLPSQMAPASLCSKTDTKSPFDIVD